MGGDGVMHKTFRERAVHACANSLQTDIASVSTHSNSLSSAERAIAMMAAVKVIGFVGRGRLGSRTVAAMTAYAAAWASVILF
jgi:hypothetical protein